jgi:hypothetical protein
MLIVFPRSFDIRKGTEDGTGRLRSRPDYVPWVNVRRMGTGPDDAPRTAETLNGRVGWLLTDPRPGHGTPAKRPAYLRGGCPYVGVARQPGSPL